MTITETQDDIIQEFALLDGDREMSVVYLMELGQKLPPFEEEGRIDANIVKGCQSKVWMVAESRHDKLYFSADSNTAVTKGLASLLVRTFSGHLPDEILSAELHFMQKIGMERFIGTQRSNGFASMIKQMKFHALAYKTKNRIKA